MTGFWKELLRETWALTCRCWLVRPQMIAASSVISAAVTPLVNCFGAANAEAGNKRAAIATVAITAK